MIRQVFRVNNLSSSELVAQNPLLILGDTLLESNCAKYQNYNDKNFENIVPGQRSRNYIVMKLSTLNESLNFRNLK